MRFRRLFPSARDSSRVVHCAPHEADTVNALDPKFRAPYRYTDTLLVLSAVKPLESDYDRARQIFERFLSRPGNCNGCALSVERARDRAANHPAGACHQGGLAV